MPLGKHCVTIRTRQVASARHLEIIRGDSVKHSEDLNRQLQLRFVTTNKTPFSFSALHRPSPGYHQDSFASWQLEAIPCRARLILGTRQNAAGHRNLDRFGRTLASSWRFRGCETARTNHGTPPVAKSIAAPSRLGPHLPWVRRPSRRNVCLRAKRCGTKEPQHRTGARNRKQCCRSLLSHRFC